MFFLSKNSRAWWWFLVSNLGALFCLWLLFIYFFLFRMIFIAGRIDILDSHVRGDFSYNRPYYKKKEKKNWIENPNVCSGLIFLAFSVALYIGYACNIGLIFRISLFILVQFLPRTIANNNKSLFVSHGYLSFLSDLCPRLQIAVGPFTFPIRQHEMAETRAKKIRPALSLSLWLLLNSI